MEELNNKEKNEYSHKKVHDGKKHACGNDGK